MTPSYVPNHGFPYRVGFVFLVQAQLLEGHFCLIIVFPKAWRVNAVQDPKQLTILGVSLTWFKGHSTGAFSITTMLPGVHLNMKICIKLIMGIVQSLFILTFVLTNLIFLIN